MQEKSEAAQAAGDRDAFVSTGIRVAPVIPGARGPCDRYSDDWEIIMPDERLDSIRQGIGVPPESQVGREAARKNHDQAAEETPIERGMGGTSDAETAPQESEMNRALFEAEAGRGGGTKASGQ